MNTITIIDKTVPTPAKFVAPPLPDFSKMSIYEWDKWLDIEYDRWVNGYGGLTGRQYAYITAGHLKNVEGKIIRPMWRDGDDLVFQSDFESRRDNEDLMIVKRREFGLTSIYGGFEPIYNCLMHPGSDNLMTSADGTRVQSMFSQKTMVMYTHLPLPKVLDSKGASEFRDLPILRKTKKGELELGREDKFGNPTTAISRIVCIQTSKDHEAAKAFENYRGMSVFVDELFLHPRPEVVHASAQATISEGFIKKGHMVFGGSCGLDDNATKEDVEALKKGAAMGERLWNDAEAKRIKCVFVPGWMCIEKAPEYTNDGKPTGKILKFMVNGWSDEKRATEWIMQRRDFLEKAKNKDMLRNFIKQYPLTVEEVFESNRNPIFPEEIYDQLAQAKKTINENPGLISMNKLSRIQQRPLGYA